MGYDEGVSLPLIHEHQMIPWNYHRRGDCCTRFSDGFHCKICDFFIHRDCVESIQSKGISLPLFHKHLMMPWNDLRRGDCCGGFESVSDGFFYCKICDVFVHKTCSESSESIHHPSHPPHALKLRSNSGFHCCDLCGTMDMKLMYRCDICDFDLDLYCSKYPPPEVVAVPERHAHKLTLLNDDTEFDCAAKCGKISYGFPYKCLECGFSFHVDCVWRPSEVHHVAELNHAYHASHPLKLMRSPTPNYSDGKCRLCDRKVDGLFYHCSSCNFTLDMRCVLNPPPHSLLDSKAHDHQLNLVTRLDSFTCNACGLKGDRSPYACFQFQCGFMIHQDCLTLPRVININRHDHRVSRTSLLGVVNSVCGVCRQKIDWTCGGYSCNKCPGYVVHSKCATRKDVWNGEELEGLPEEIEDIEPYVVIDDNTIDHFSHTKHYLILNVNDALWEDKKRCNACVHPIGLQSFYGCMDCNFFLHKSCADFPKKKLHVLHNERLKLISSLPSDTFFECDACDRVCNGFAYAHGRTVLDVLCGSISEPFVHPSHPQHPLYHIPTENREICNGCNLDERNLLRCIEDGCGFVLGFKCATLPQVVKHRVDDHPLTLCYGEKSSGKYWCDICEKETNPKNWFYTSQDHRASLHTKCVLGDFEGFMERSRVNFGGWKRRIIKVYDVSYEVVLNNNVSRPICWWCEFHCMYPIILKSIEASGTYICSIKCLNSFHRPVLYHY